MKKQPNRRQPTAVLDAQRLTAAAGGSYELEIPRCGTPPWGPGGPPVIPIEIGPIRVGP